jgi:hypothetical protein
MWSKLVSGIDIQTIDALRNLGIEEINKYTLEKMLHQETFVERSDFIKNFSEKEWDILVEHRVITQGGKILLPCRSSFELGKIVQGKFGDKTATIQSYLQKIFSKHGTPITQLSEYNFSLLEQPYIKNIVEILLAETGLYLEKETLYVLKTPNGFNFDLGTKKVNIKSIGWGRYDVFVDSQKVEHFESKKEITEWRTDNNGGFFSKEEKEKIIKFLEGVKVFLSMQVRDYLFSISKSFVEKTVN